jgi:hypothetical protein
MMAGGPVPIGQLVAWSGGELALSTAPSGGPIQGWLSHDGHHWVPLPDGTFGATNGAVVAAAGNHLVVIGQDRLGVFHEDRSVDGVTWLASTPAAPVALGLTALQGNARGFVGLVDDAKSTLVFSPDGETWATVELLATGGTPRVASVAATAMGFVAVGDVTAGTAAAGVTLAVSAPAPVSPHAWLSADGSSWHEASVEQGVTESLGSLSVGADGLIAIGFSGGTPGVATYWTSVDGTAWVHGDPPLGVVTQGEGVGSVNGAFLGDGTRLLVYGTTSEAGTTEWLTSSDGRTWTPLTITEEGVGVPWFDVSPFLVPDGIVFAAPHATWFGRGLP